MIKQAPSSANTAAASVTLMGIETSCDETAAAIIKLENTPDGPTTEILSDIILTQFDEHAPYGGIVPEIAARAHAELADTAIAKALDGAGMSLSELDAVAATSGPGLIGGVLVGMMTGKALAMGADLPFLPINHLEGHALSPRISSPCAFPYLLLLVSGGHCQFIHVAGLGDYKRLGSTIDDAAGEAFDKTAKLLGLGFPGGPVLEKLAQSGDPQALDFPRPLLNRDGLDMSFAGLKTAAARAIQDGELTEQRKADIAASFQQAVTDVLAEKTKRALAGFAPETGAKRLVVAGGVAANQSIRTALAKLAMSEGTELITPPLRYCTDNAVMIAQAGAEHYLAGARGDLSANARPRWPLDEASAASNPIYGRGKRGAKA
ncbi:MAG: tRNA (adenosine(37)-N6)-threonylcarbamoyltransferase complex transferase subunit TsaD [Hyphomonadaceae bacterium]